MKQFFIIIAGIIAMVSAVIFGFSYQQVQRERASMIDDLQRRTSLLSDSFKESVRTLYQTKATSTLQNVLDKFAGRERLLGLAIYDSDGVLFATSDGLPALLTEDAAIPKQAMETDSKASSFSSVSKDKVYVFSSPIRHGEEIIGAITVFQKANYIDENLYQIWKTNAERLGVLVILFSILVGIILRFTVYEPIKNMAEAIRRTRTGSLNGGSIFQRSHSFFSPISSEVSKMAQSLVQARSAASEEARLRLEKLDTPWTAERLKEFFKAYLKGRHIFVVSNREPYIHKKIKGEVKYVVPASGMITALEPIMDACGGTWLAHGSGDADKLAVGINDKIMVPPDDPKYTLRRLWLSEQEISGYYVGFANEALWPLCHLAHTRPIFRQEDWTEYRKVNGKFAEALLSEMKNVRRPIVLIQDYHFSLLPEMIKKARPDAEVGIFWHIPWPNAEFFSICPWRKEILAGMLGADVIGFHTQQYCNNFFETVGKEIESLADLEKFAITRDGHTAHIKPFPISVAFTGGDVQESEYDKSGAILEKFVSLKTKKIGIGVDRMDYTKGILERLKGIEFFFGEHPNYKQNFTFLQIAPPSRERVEKYRLFSEEVKDEVNRINEKLGVGDWLPIILVREHLTHDEIYELYRSADVCLVTSLSDGMNLVAKEFVAARNDDAGVLVLSRFTGAARDIGEAIMINPYSAEETAESIHKALVMPMSEQRRRMKKMRNSVKNYNIYRWAAEFLRAVTSVG